MSHPYFSLASDRDFSLLNQPAVLTYFLFTHSSRPSVLDLAFANSHLFPAFCRWDTPLPSTGSDQVAIVISFCSPRFRHPDPSPNWAKPDWITILPQLPSLVPPPSPPSCPIPVFEEWFDVHSNRIKSLITTSTPTSWPSPRSKPWWSPLLSSLCQAFHSASRSFRSSRDPYDYSAMRSTRKSYFAAIRKGQVHLLVWLPLVPFPVIRMGSKKTRVQRTTAPLSLFSGQTHPGRHQYSPPGPSFPGPSSPNSG